MMWPGVCGIEYINWSARNIERTHNLDIQLPRWKISLLYRIEEIFDVIVRLLSGQSQRYVCGQGFNSSLRFEVPFDILETAVLLVQLAGLHVSMREQTCLPSVYV